MWVFELTARFWDAAGPPPPFPRDLRSAVTFGLPLSVVDRPELSLSKVTTHLNRSGLPVPFRGPDRPLRAALYCWRGCGFLFLDANDPPAERRFSVAHFLRDCDDLRRRAVRALGPVALEILDGRRPTADERIAALLRNLSLGPHAHLMSRTAAGRPMTPSGRPNGGPTGWHSNCSPRRGCSPRKPPSPRSSCGWKPRSACRPPPPANTPSNSSRTRESTHCSRESGNSATLTSNFP